MTDKDVIEFYQDQHHCKWNDYESPSLNIKQKLVAIKKRLVMLKYFMGRATTYLALLNSSMILFLVISKLKDAGYVTIEIESLLIPLILLGITFLIFVGWVDTRLLKATQDEATYHFNRTPPLVEMKKLVEEIHERLNKNG